MSGKITIHNYTRYRTEDFERFFWAAHNITATEGLHAPRYSGHYTSPFTIYDRPLILVEAAPGSSLINNANLRFHKFGVLQLSAVEDVLLPLNLMALPFADQIVPDKTFKGWVEVLSWYWSGSFNHWGSPFQSGEISTINVASGGPGWKKLRTQGRKAILRRRKACELLETLGRLSTSASWMTRAASGYTEQLYRAERRAKKWRGENGIESLGIQVPELSAIADIMSDNASKAACPIEGAIAKVRKAIQEEEPLYGNN